jgi:Uma2 family endonuclease
LSDRKTKEKIAMSTASLTSPNLLTAEQFAARPDPGFPEELVRGRIVPMPMPKPRHGQICGQAYYLLRSHIEAQDLGHLLSNDSGVITERGPDTVRGADVCFYTYARVPKGPLADRYLDVAPDLIVEVLSPSDRWPKVLGKVAEYLDAGTTVVLVLDDQRRMAQLYRADGMTRLLGAADELSIPDLLGEFRVRISRFFD